MLVPALLYSVAIGLAALKSLPDNKFPVLYTASGASDTPTI